MADDILAALRGVVGPSNLLTGVELSPYVLEGRTPMAAAFPGSVEEVSAATRRLVDGLVTTAPPKDREVEAARRRARAAERFATA